MDDDIYGKEVVKFVVKANYQEVVINEHEFIATQPPKGVVPCKGCDYVLLGCSVSKAFVYRASEYPEVKWNKQFDGVKVYGYCLEKDWDDVRQYIVDRIKFVFKEQINDHYTKAHMLETIVQEDLSRF